MLAMACLIDEGHPGCDNLPRIEPHGIWHCHSEIDNTTTNKCIPADLRPDGFIIPRGKFSSSSHATAECVDRILVHLGYQLVLPDHTTSLRTGRDIL